MGEEETLSNSKDDVKDASETLDRLVDERNEEPDKKISPSFKNVRFQVLASCVCALTIVQAGLNMSYSSVLLPNLQEMKNLNISTTETSWIAGLAVLTTPVGSLLCGPIMDGIGRKTGLLTACIPSLLGWCLTSFATPRFLLPMIYIARMLGGFGGGMSTIFLVYLPEISHEQYRPMLLGLNSIAVSLGVLLVTFTGMLMDWQMMAYCFGVFTVINIILIWVLVPESPFWLMTLSKRSNRRALAEKSLHRLNPDEQMYERQLKQLIATVREKEEQALKEANSKISPINKLKATFLQFVTPPAALPMLLLTVLMILQQLSGGYSIIFYTIQIFKELGGKFGGGLNENHALILMGILRFITSIISAGLSRVIGRRPLLMSSALGMAISSLMVPLWHYANVKLENAVAKDNPTNEGHWLPMVCVLAFVCWSAIGVLNIPWTLIGEILPTSIRGVGSGFFISLAYIAMFSVVKMFPFLLNIVSINVIFLIQGIFCIIILIFVYIFVPETLGKSLNEIQKHFSRE